MSPAIEIPQAAERDYFRAFGIVAMFIAASPARAPCLSGFTRDLGRSLDSIRSRWHSSIEICHAWWLGNADSARTIIDRVTAAHQTDSRGCFEMHTDEIADRIKREASALGITLTNHADAIARVHQALARVDGVIDQASRDGELQWFNRAYRGWRQSVPDTLALSLPYGLARSRLRSALVRRIASGGPAELTEDLLSEVLPAPKGPALAAPQAAATGPTAAPPVSRAGGPPMANAGVRLAVTGTTRNLVENSRIGVAPGFTRVSTCAPRR